jgi:hypothetical protein
MKILYKPEWVVSLPVWPIGAVVDCHKCRCKWMIENNNDYVSVEKNGHKTLNSRCPTCGEYCSFVRGY